jgi:hypothetical protein
MWHPACWKSWHMHNLRSRTRFSRYLSIAVLCGCAQLDSPEDGDARNDQDLSRARLDFGMGNNTSIDARPEVNSTRNFVEVVAAHFTPVQAKLHIRRSYESTIPASFAESSAGDDPANGLTSFLSVKPPDRPGTNSPDVEGTARGDYDGRIATFCASVPSGTYLTMFHEPEGDMTGVQYVAMFTRFYDVCKSAQPDAKIGYVAGGFQWRPASQRTAVPDAWWMGADHVDFLAIDAYINDPAGAHILPELPTFARWYAWATTKHKPIVLSEFGVESEVRTDDQVQGFSDQERSTLIEESLAWVWTQPAIRMVLWFNGTQAAPGGRNHVLNPTKSYESDEFSGARQAWIRAVRRYGRRP